MNHKATIIFASICVIETVVLVSIIANEQALVVAESGDNEVFQSIYDMANTPKGVENVTEQQVIQHLWDIYQLEKRYAGDRGEVLVRATRYFIDTEQPHGWVVLPVLVNKLRVSDSDMVNAAAPRLQDPDARFVKVMYSLMESVDDMTYAGDYVLKHGEPESADLVRWMYGRDAAGAMKSLSRLGGLKKSHRDKETARKVSWAVREVEDAIWKIISRMRAPSDFRYEPLYTESINNLDFLSLSAHWWVRLYAAQQCKDHPELRTEAIVERLADDQNLLVREMVGSIVFVAVEESGPPDQQ